ncbi:MAG: FAD dependent oxidoreductase, partial [Veillonella dispar DORA_11]
VFVYTLFIEVHNEAQVMKKLGKEKDISVFAAEDPEPIVFGSVPLAHRPVVMGFGPAGMLAAFYLAREGYRPIVLERGQDVDTRSHDVETFWKKGIFKPESNVQFGEGGAGTFSDGKLTTRITHPRLHEISKYFVEFGAPEEILYKHKPHVGTDKLRTMVKAMRERIIEWGGEVRFGSKVTDLFIENDRIVGVEVNGSERIDTTVVLSGVGHSARDTYEMLYKRNVEMTAKPFAIGVRIEHDQAVIDESQYGVEPSSLGLGAAEYSLVYHDKESGRTAYSFCMCPGGQV